MNKYHENEWVKGPFANTVIEGFITRVSDSTCDIIVKRIDPTKDPLPPHLHVGSIHTLPIRVVHDFFTVLESSQQQDLIKLANQIGQENWVLELVDQFKNPFEIDEKDEINQAAFTIYSDLIKGEVLLTVNSRKRLFRFYQEAEIPGIESQINHPDEINDTETLDKVIASIVLVAKNEKGISYVRSLVKREDG